MKKITLVLFACALSTHAQRISNASFLKVSDKADIIVPFKYEAEGVKTPIEWGLDLAWLDEANVRTGVFYAGKDLIDIVRLSFQPTFSVEDGKLNAEQKRDLEKRITAVKNWLKTGISYNVNCDHPSVDSWYNVNSIGSEGRAKRWAQLIDLTIDYYKSKGITNIVSISPFNEPDYGWNQGYSDNTRKADFKAICKLFKEDEVYAEKYKGVRMCGGNTLNDDKAYEWWNYLKDVLDEGNTHQLAGNFDNYASFFEKVREKGHHATADELHNTMEAMVGVEYGMQTGIWWGTCEKTRSDFMKATNHNNPGDRLAYAEHRDRWTSASVYRHADGKVQAFGGSSERQANTTTYLFTSTDQPVWYNGQRGRDYSMKVLGGTGYQQGQTGFEQSIDVQCGDDVMPLISDGVYKIVNVKTGKPLGLSGNPSKSWTSIKQVNNNSKNPLYQQWRVNQVTSGDRDYYILSLNTTGDPVYIDILNWNYNSGADVGTYPGGLGSNEQWYLEYAGNGAFYIRSRYSTKCLEVQGGNTAEGTNIMVAELSGKDQQKWRFLTPDVTPDKKVPATPTELAATENNASIELTWTAPADNDIKSYTVLRSKDDIQYITLCNNITTTSFTDNEAEDDTQYYYKVYAEDKSMNRSKVSDPVKASCHMQKGLVMDMPLNSESGLFDASVNANHGVMDGSASYVNKNEREGLSLDGSNQFVQLPYTIANHDALTISAWVYYRGGNAWQRIFDFGNGTDQYMFLTVYDGTRMRFAIKNGGEEEIIRPNTSKKPANNKWAHVAVTIDNGVGILYLDGVEVARNEGLTIKPSDIRPTLNYIGRSQYAADPLFKGYVNDFKVYNYALSAEEIADVIDNIEIPTEDSSTSNFIYDLNGRRLTHPTRGIVVEKNKKLIKK